MDKIIFKLNNNNTIIEYNPGEQIKVIIDKFITKTCLDIRKFEFKYKEMKINELELTVEEIFLEEDKKNNEIYIDVTEKGKEEIKEIIEYDNKVNHIFIKNPNFKYKLTITNENDSFGANDIFEVFICYKDKKEYIISPNIKNHNLDIYALIDNKKVRSLIGHKVDVSTVKYFISNKNYAEYLISADKSKKAILWDITNDYHIKKYFDLDPNLNNIIYNSLIVFPNNYKDLILFAQIKPNEITKFYLLSWHNKKNNNYYVIKLSSHYVEIENLFEKEKKYQLKKNPEDSHLSGFIYTKDNSDYLCYSSTNGYINIWDLYERKIFKRIYIEASYLIYIIPWNEKYLIVADYSNCSFKVIDFESGKIISDIGGQNEGKVICVKKIFHPIYGESLLSASEDKTIKLWTI